MRRAMIDIGSNSVRLLNEREGDRHRDVAVTRLAEGMHEGMLQPAPMDRTLGAVRAFAEHARKMGCLPAAYATSAVRDAANGADFARRLRDEAGIELRILTEEQEAMMSFAGATKGVAGEACVVDVGGRSSETAVGRDGQMRSSFSLPLGAVNMTERGGAAAELIAYARRRFSAEGFALPAGARCIAVAGTATSLAAMEKRLVPYDERQVHGTALTDTQIECWAERLEEMTPDERKAIPGLDPARAPVMRAGCCVLLGWMRSFGVRKLTVSTSDGLDAMLDAANAALTPP